MDTKQYTLQFHSADKYPWNTMRGRQRHQYVMKIEDIKTVKKDPQVSSDFFGTLLEGDQCNPGPFGDLEPEKIYHIDPRKL